MRILAAGSEGTGKSMFVLSAAKIGGLAIADTEFGMHNYLVPHPSGKDKEFTLLDETKKLLGIAADEAPLVRWIQTNDLVQVKAFMTGAASDPAIATLAVDSASILWDIASSAVAGGQDRGDWNRVKQPLRMLQYLVLASKKHYIFTAHMNKMFNENMTAVIGEFPWSEKKDPHWGDLNLKMSFPAGQARPDAFILKERSSGKFKKGDLIREVSMSKILAIWPGAQQIGTPLSPNEAAYRVDAAGRKES